jgi:hypothetical protein
LTSAAYSSGVGSVRADDTSPAPERTSNSCEPAPHSCEINEDCEEGFCGWNASEARRCKPWAGLGSPCEGFAFPQDRQVCAPWLDCYQLEPTGDLGGTCILPEAKFPCGDTGLTCEFERDYCHVSVALDGRRFACEREPECFRATCECLRAHGRVAADSCDDNRGLPAVVTHFN